VVPGARVAAAPVADHRLVDGRSANDCVESLIGRRFDPCPAHPPAQARPDLAQPCEVGRATRATHYSQHLVQDRCRTGISLDRPVAGPLCQLADTPCVRHSSQTETQTALPRRAGDGGRVIQAGGRDGALDSDHSRTGVHRSNQEAVTGKTRVPVPAVAPRARGLVGRRFNVRPIRAGTCPRRPTASSAREVSGCPASR
jgi:hypothetical protein